VVKAERGESLVRESSGYRGGSFLTNSELINIIDSQHLEIEKYIF
jgi:hypothetical protein